VVKRLLPTCVVAALSCQPLIDPTESNSVALCPKPCPAECEQACLPTGYCDKQVLTAAELNVAPASVHQDWFLSTAGFPPGAAVAYTLHAGLDVVERGEAIPATVDITLNGDTQNEFSLVGTFDSFPIWSDYSSVAIAQNDGSIRLGLNVVQCALINNSFNEPSTCLLAGSSTLSMQLVSNAAWAKAPPCD
jgi:hypothetical protein